MATELVLRKRASTRVGEIGLFCDVQVFEDDFAAIKNDSEVKAVVTQARSLRQHKFAWALATKVAEACDFLQTKDDAMNYILIEAKHARFIYDPLRKISYAVPKPTNWGAMDGVAYTKLLRRMTDVVATHIVPGINKAEIKAEIEKMLHPDLIPTDEMPPEPPPHDTIPDGPGVGHNSSAAGVSTTMPDDRAPDPNHSGAQRQQEPATAVRAPSYADASGAATRTVTPEPPQAQETASTDSGETVTLSELKRVWTVDMAGEPDWAAGEMPGDAGMYAAYARFHIERKNDHGLAMGWLIGDQQTELRRQLKVGMDVRASLKRFANEKFGVKE